MNVATIFGLGVVIAMSPCPLATNIAATGYLVREQRSRSHGILQVLLYAIGRALVYAMIGLVLAQGMTQAPQLSFWLQENLPLVLGPAMVFAGLVLLDFLPFVSIGITPGVAGIKGMRARWGALAALLMGFLFALSLCPPTAAVLFGTVIPGGIAQGEVALLWWCVVFGIGTALPVMMISLLVQSGSKMSSTFFKHIPKFQQATRLLTGWGFLLYGLYDVVHRHLLN